MRGRICLNGEWDFLPDYRGQSPEEALQDCRWEEQKIRVPSSWRWIINPAASFQPYDLFGYPPTWNEAESGVVGRPFAVHKTGDERVFLILGGVLQRSAVYVNGEKVKQSQEAYLPIEVDITDQVRNGDGNELKVWCGPFENILTETGKKVLAPHGSWFAQMARGIWQDVYLEYRPPAYIQGVYVKTSVRQQRIVVTVSVVNQSERRRGAVRLRIVDGGTPVKEMASGEVSLEPGQVTHFRLEESWPDAIRWSPEHPHLYMLQAEWIGPGGSVDRFDTRCGFREVWIEGHKFYLNGTRINLRGDAWHYQGFAQQNKQYALNWYQACKETGINFVRLHAMPYPEFYLDAADEAGMLIVDESAIYGSSKNVQADHPRFIDACRQHLRSLVLRDRNHPSIIIWSMQNEMRWVDGRDGYKAAMPGLTRTIKELDDTRPVSYDGDNRLVDPAEMEIISMHYNIDGTVAGWQKDKPLIFGEHGKWHYVAPQVCTELAGPGAYLSFDACLDSIGLHERLFIEYARREEVTGVTPFNMANYMVKTLPHADIPLTWDDLSTPGVKPKGIRRHALTINNGYAPDEPLLRPNPSWKHVRAAFKPVTIVPNEYNTAFFGGSTLSRSFSIYNDTEKAAEAKITCRLLAGDGECIGEGEEAFAHAPGERREWGLTLPLPDVAETKVFTLELALYHGGDPVHTLGLAYRIYPRSYKDTPIHTCNKRVALLGDDASYAVITRLLDRLERLEDCSAGSLRGLDVLVIGKDFEGQLAALQPALQDFVAGGGFLLIMEQSRETPGEVTLSGRRFFSAFMNDKDHPIFRGLADEGLRFWGADNINQPGCAFMVQNAFYKPAQGDFTILLECGEGDFGWGGLLWTPLVEYTIGQGKVVLNQVDLIANFDHVPPACLLLRNVLAYGIEHEGKPMGRAGLLALPGSASEGFLRETGLECTPVSGADEAGSYSLIVLDPDALDEQKARWLHAYVERGGRLMVLPVEPRHQALLTALVGAAVEVEEATVYQVKANPHAVTRGLAPHDLYHFERVTYTPANKENVILCQNAIRLAGGENVFESVKNPWYDYFVRGFDGEYLKTAIATMAEEAECEPKCYGVVKAIGKGAILLSQIRPLRGNDKIKRVYTRLLSNVGASIHTHLLRTVKEDRDYGIESFMALPYQEHVEYDEMEAYFRDRNYTLNNLGEGVYGWMRQVEKREGVIAIPESAGKTYFLTVFVESDINRDPTRRVNNELPDSSIVPDLYVKINASFKLFVDGHCYADCENPQGDDLDLKIDDVVLDKGMNNVLLVCRGRKEDVRLNVCFKSKYGDLMEGLRYHLTLD